MKTSRIVVAAVVGSGLALSPVAHADQAVTGVATGLDNPRGLAFAPNGNLYVTEAGVGGDGPCFEGPEGGEVCWGTSGAITRVTSAGEQSRVITGLPSIAESDGTFAIGPSDVSLHGVGGMYFTVGLGADPAMRDGLPPEGQDGNGWLLRGTPGKATWQQVADIAGHEAEHNPDGGVADSNPNSVAALAGGRVVADAGGNALIWVDPTGKTATLAVFPTREVLAPPFLGMPEGALFPMESVPTSVVRGPDGAFYVGELTGFPFPPGEARVYRVVPGEEPEVYAEGFTNIIDIGFDSDGTLYVLEIAHAGLLFAENDPRGALIRVNDDGTREIVLHDELVMPGGLALRGGDAYISNCSVCPGDGSFPAGAGHVLQASLG